jgi:hypothetical protein
MRVLYHSGCPDGFGAAWVFHKKFGPQYKGLSDHHFKFIPVKYGAEPPWEELKADSTPIYIVDFSYSRGIIAEMRTMALVTVIDHHKTAKEELEGLPGVIFDMTKSGCVLAWEFCFPDQPIPRMLEYIQDRDLWRFKLGNSRAVNAYIFAEDYDFGRWDKLSLHIESNIAFDMVVSHGEAMLRSQEKRNESIAAQAQLMCFHAMNDIPVVNCPLPGTSEVLHMLIKKHSAPFAVGYCDRADWKRQWGLRGDGSVDVAAIAEHYGGGGHHDSAGFVTDSSNPFWVLKPFLPSKPDDKIDS